MCCGLFGFGLHSFLSCGCRFLYNVYEYDSFGVNRSCAYTVQNKLKSIFTVNIFIFIFFNFTFAADWSRVDNLRR